MEGGGVVVPNQSPDQGFFHMPKLQVPTYQKPRVFVPLNYPPRPPLDGNASTSDPKQRPVAGPPVMPNATQLSGTTVDGMFDGKRIRKTMVRKTVDYNTSVVKYLENRVWQRDGRDARAIQPDALYQLEVTPPCDMQQKPMNCLTSKFMRQSTNKFRCPIFCISWTPEGRRLVTGASSGEFTLWNGLTFSFETILQAHETSVRAMVWSHNDQWMLTADHAGFIKYWQSNMNNVKMYQGHKEPIRSISFCPTDSKFATCSDDGTVRVWDFLRCYEEKILRGHGADVKCVDWHPQKSLIASGSKDNQVPIKLWDPKSGQSLATL
ncbi:pre-mRNA 3' end processing protein WDR33-like [Ruditapes philippinarum]|nr:pre-mRNA 3' end processing protein WDR33-like [Ruditapes philippinarum]